MVLGLGGTAVADIKVVPVNPQPASDGYVPSLRTKQWLADKLWPKLPDDHGLSLEDVITDHITDYGNLVGEHLDLLSHDMLMLRVNGRTNSARLRLGGGNLHYLTFMLDSDVHFHDGMASVKAHLDVGVGGHMLHVDVPDFDLIPDDFHGERIVELNVPLYERKF
jgi:hypothetical protein